VLPSEKVIGPWAAELSRVIVHPRYRVPAVIHGLLLKSLQVAEKNSVRFIVILVEERGKKLLEFKYRHYSELLRFWEPIKYKGGTFYPGMLEL
jgi:hypothetical protein